MTAQRFPSRYLTPADVRQVIADTDELAAASGHDSAPSGAHRAARLATPAGTAHDRQLEWCRLGDLQRCYWPLVVSPTTPFRAYLAWIDVHLTVVDLRWDLTAGSPRDLARPPADHHPLSLRSLGHLADDDATSRAVEMRAAGKHLGYIARHLGVTVESTADQLVRHGLADRIDAVVGDHRQRAAADLDRITCSLWPSIARHRPNPDAAVALLRVARRRAEVLGLLQLPPRPGSRRS